MVESVFAADRDVGATTTGSSISLPAPSEGMENAGVFDQLNSGSLYLLLVVNGTPGPRPVPVSGKGGHFSVDSADLRAARLPIPDTMQGIVDVSALEGVRVQYDVPSQQLHLDVPPDWLPPQVIGSAPFLQGAPAQAGRGLLINYDGYYSDTVGFGRSLAVWTEQRIFGAYGVASNSGSYRKQWQGASLSSSGYLRYDTFWRWNDESRMIAYQAGDVISDSLSWSHSVRLGGFRISRNFAVRPDLITYPTLSINGSNELPSTVELLVNGYKTSAETLQAGPYVINDVPLLNGAGQATVVTTDALGRQVSTTVPFYVSNMLLAPGLSDFDLSVGKLRRDYGTRNFSYGQSAASGIYRRGLNRWLTLSGHLEASKQLGLGGLGADIALGHYGTLSLAASQSRWQRREGQQYVFGYSYRTQAFGIDLQHSLRSGEFSDLSVIANATELSRHASQATLSFTPFGVGNGNLSLGYYALTSADAERVRLLSLSFSRPLFGDSSLYFSVYRDLGDGGSSAYLQWTIPLERRRLGTIAGSLRRASSGGYSPQLSWSRSAPSEGGWGWNLAYTARQRYRQAGVTWVNEDIRVQAGEYGESSDLTRWADLSGSLIVMDGRAFTANRVADAFVLVSTSGYPGVPVRYENRLLGSTDASGHLLVPSVASYYPAKYSIDTLQLPADVRADSVEHRLAVREASGTLLKFEVAPMLAVLFAVHDGAGHALPAGLQVRHSQTGQTGFTGHDGLVYFEGVGRENHIDVVLETGRTCAVDLTLDDAHSGIQQLPPQRCSTEISR